MSTKNKHLAVKTNNKGIAEITGTVTLILPNAFYRVTIEGIGEPLLCYLSGKMVKNYIKPVLGDKVRVEMSPTDLTKGRIVFLLRN